MKYSEMRGKIFKIDPRNFRRIFSRACGESKYTGGKNTFSLSSGIPVQWSL